MRLPFKAVIWYGAMVHARLRWKKSIEMRDGFDENHCNAGTLELYRYSSEWYGGA